MTEIKGEVNELLPNTYLGGSRDCKVIKKKKKKKCRGLFGVPILKSRSSSHPLFFGGGILTEVRPSRCSKFGAGRAAPLVLDKKKVLRFKCYNEPQTSHCHQGKECTSPSPTLINRHILSCLSLSLFTLESVLHGYFNLIYLLKNAV